MLSIAQVKSQSVSPQSGRTPMDIGLIEKEVLEVVKTWNDCFEKNNASAYFSYIHNDLTLFTPSNPYRVDGKQEDQKEFEWSLGRSRTTVHFFQELQPSVQVYGNTAIVTYYNRGAYGPDGNEQMYYFKETDVLVKEDGKWLIVHIHVSK
jgi:ketosteroid isomerase-like protein